MAQAFLAEVNRDLRRSRRRGDTFNVSSAMRVLNTRGISAERMLANPNIQRAVRGTILREIMNNREARAGRVDIATSADGNSIEITNRLDSSLEPNHLINYTIRRITEVGNAIGAVYGRDSLGESSAQLIIDPGAARGLDPISTAYMPYRDWGGIREQVIKLFAESEEEYKAKEYRPLGRGTTVTFRVELPPTDRIFRNIFQRDVPRARVRERRGRAPPRRARVPAALRRILDTSESSGAARRGSERRHRTRQATARARSRRRPLGGGGGDLETTLTWNQAEGLNRKALATRSWIKASRSVLEVPDSYNNLCVFVALGMALAYEQKDHDKKMYYAYFKSPRRHILRLKYAKELQEKSGLPSPLPFERIHELGKF